MRCVIKLCNVKKKEKGWNGDRSKRQHTLIGWNGKSPVVIYWFAPVEEVQELDNEESDAAVYGNNRDGGGPLLRSRPVDMERLVKCSTTSRGDNNEITTSTAKQTLGNK